MSKHTPGPMHPLTAIEVAAGAAKHWRARYKHWGARDCFADGATKSSVNAALNRVAHTPENIEKVLNRGWAYPQCDCCGEYRHVVVEMAQEFSEDRHRLCSFCVHAAASILNQFPDARAAIAKAEGRS